ncbi:Uncharacterised protein [Streptococcus pneumoniae]|nr:Uncharacterised protein [Streptococcus pneumoniae]
MAFEELNTAESRKKHLGIIEDVLAVNSEYQLCYCPSSGRSSSSIS